MKLFYKTKTALQKIWSAKFLRVCTWGIIISVIAFFLLDVTFPLQTNISYSQVMLDENGKVLHSFLNEDDKWRMKTELDEIMPELKKAIIYKEDKYFYYHFGINPLAIGRALFNNLLKSKRTSGASTITMQVARLLNPKERTYLNKLTEMFRALQLEWHYSKDEILQLYINLIPYGGNIEGIKSASVLYFDQLPNQLSLAQLVTLTIIPNRPTSLKLGANNVLIKEECNKWLQKFAQEGVFPQKQVDDALSEPLLAKRQATPQFAPHFAWRIKKMASQEANVHTTIHKNKQEKVQQLVHNYSKRLHGLGIFNAAVLVLNNETMQVEAYVGSSDFYDFRYSGQVDGITAIRSPGSTLKPLVYALGFDLGKITPKSVINDVPTDWQGYQPDNFNKQFNGKVNIEKALSLSLNIPAVKVLSEVTVPVFTEKLIQADFRSIKKQKDDIGLSMILGGCGVTLEELVGLFASFANEGNYQPVSYLQKSTSKKAVKLISPASTFAINEILTLASRPDLPNTYQNSLRAPKIAWKTGTSYGRRDAWSIGYNAKYTIGVWVGNFSGVGVNELTGSEIATPLLFEIFNTLQYDMSERWFFAPKDMQYRLVCTETGLPANDFCENQALDYYIPLISNHTKCEHLKEIQISVDEQRSYCMSCLPNAGYKVKLYPNLAPELISYYDTEGIAYEKIPPHNALCQRVSKENAPSITSPAADREYIVDRNDPPDLMLSCQAHNEVKTVYWYINDKFYREAPANLPVFFKPTLGSIKISCSDDKGRNTDIKIKVLYE